MSTGKLKAISLFCGIGIADLALHKAAEMLGREVEIIAAYDNWKEAVNVYNSNFLHPATVCDINNVVSLPRCDFVFGGPPCQAWSNAGRKQGKKDPRDCTDKTWELVQGHNYLLENVKQLFDAPHISYLNASTYGDCTGRRRYFHSNLPLLDIPVLFDPTYIRDIRDHDEDLRILKKRGLVEKAGNHQHYSDDECFQSLTAHSWHGHDCRGYGKLLPISLRGFSSHVRPYNDSEILGTLVGNSWHGNPESYLKGCRNPSILEMQRAHSIPESWNWGKTLKTDKGKMIANSWPLRLGISVFHSYLRNFI